MKSTQFTYRNAQEQFDSYIRDLERYDRYDDGKEFDLFVNFTTWQALTTCYRIEYRAPRDVYGTPDTIKDGGLFYGRFYYKGFIFNIYITDTLEIK